MSDLTLYYHPMSQPSRAVWTVMHLGNIQAEYKKMQIPAENRTPEFAKINPFQTVPVLKDDELIIFESHSILKYLCRTNQSLKQFYPEDIKQQAKVDVYLDWHHAGCRANTAFFWRDSFAGPKFFGKPALTEAQMGEFKKKMEKTFDTIENIFLGGDKKFKYIQNQQNATIADFSCLMELDQLFTCNFEWVKYPNTQNWMINMFTTYPKIKETHKALFEIIKNEVPTPNDFLKKMLAL